MSEFLDYMDEIYEELVEEFGHEIESDCIHKWYKSHALSVLLFENTRG